jgi:putative transposase
MLYMMLRNEGKMINHKRVERLYKEEKLALRRKKRRKFSAVRMLVPRASVPMECLALDFMSDATVEGRKLRVLTTVDEYSKISPLITVAHSISGQDVVKVLKQIAITHGIPCRLRMDNGPEFRSRAVVEWALTNQIRLDYIQPGKPTQNAFIESFNARVREECLDQEIFFDLNDAKQKLDRWWHFYNNFRPHSALGGIPPSRFATGKHVPILLTGT